MVPPEASHADEPGVDDELGYAFQYKRHADAYSDDSGDLEPLDPNNTGRRARWRTDSGHEFKPEVDTGEVSDSCFSWRKLWKYTGPGRTSLLIDSVFSRSSIDAFHLGWLM